MFRHSFYSFRDTMSQWMAYFLLLTLFVSLFVFLPITVKAVNEPSTLALLNGSAAALTTATVGTEITGDAYVLVYTQLHAAGTGAQVWANADNFSVTIPANMPAPLSTDGAGTSQVAKVCYGAATSTIVTTDCTNGTEIPYAAALTAGSWDDDSDARIIHIEVSADMATVLNGDNAGITILLQKGASGTTAPTYADATTDITVVVATVAVDSEDLAADVDAPDGEEFAVAAGALTNGDVIAGDATAAPTGTEVGEAPTSYKFVMQTPVALVSGDKIVLTFGTGFTVTNAISNTAKVSSLTPTTANVSKANDAAGAGAANVAVTTYATLSAGRTATITLGATVEATKYIIFTIVTGASETVTANPRSVGAAASVNAVDFDIQETGGASRVVLADVAETYTSGALVSPIVNATTDEVSEASVYTLTFTADHALINTDQIVYTFGSDFTMGDDADLVANTTAFTIGVDNKLASIGAIALASKVITLNIDADTTVGAGQAVVITFDNTVVDNNPRAVKTNATSAVDITTKDTNNAVIDDLATPAQDTYTTGALTASDSAVPDTAYSASAHTLTFTADHALISTDKIKYTFGSDFTMDNDTDLVANTTAFTIGVDNKLASIGAIALASKVITLNIDADTTVGAGQAVVITFDTTVVDNNPAVVKTATTSAVDVATTDSSDSGIDDLATPVQDTYTAASLTSTNVEPGALTSSTNTTATVTFTTPIAIAATDKIKVTFGSGYNLAYVSATSGTCSSMDGTFSTGVSGQIVTITRAAGSEQAATSAETCTITNVITPPPGSSGTYTISITDSSSNTRTTNAAVTADTLVDWQPVTGPGTISVVINNGDATTLNRNATLKISASNATMMKISESFNFSSVAWETYAVSKAFTFSSDLGQKFVYVIFKSASGIESNPASDYITLTAATSTSTDATTTTQTPATPATPATQATDQATQTQPSTTTDTKQSSEQSAKASVPADTQLINIRNDVGRIISTTIDALLIELGIKRNTAKESSVEKGLVAKISVGKSVSQAVKSTLTNFIAYGTSTTRVLGDGERAGVVNSFKSAFGKLPESSTDWEDVVKIANGRWPSQISVDKESSAETAFEKIYLRTPDRDNPKDDAAVVVMAYGLRPGQRNLNSEKAAIKSFRAIYGKSPVSATDWDTVRAIAYSGAKR